MAAPKKYNLDTKNISPDIIKHIGEEIRMVVPDYENYTILQIRWSEPQQIFYNISDACPPDKHNKIQKAILHNAELLNLPVTTEDLE